MLFTDLKLAEPVQRRLADKGFTEPTPIQAETIPLALNNRDLIACAKTGSGKTLAYLLPIFQYIYEKNQHPRVTPSPTADTRSSATALGRQFPLALVLAPTRELVVQIAEEAAFFADAVGFKVATIFGGVDHDKQRQELASGAHLVVATPGRLLDFIRSGEANLSTVVRIVLDEADRMLDMGFIDDVRKILERCSANENEDRQFSLFSATINFSALYSVWEFMREPEEILINPELIDHASITQEMLHLGQDEKLPYLIQMLENNKLEPVIIFTNSRQYVDVLVKNLNHHNIAAAGLSSMVTQNKRLRILDDFKSNKFRVLVATDVASRGLHIEDVQLVINYDIPQDPETYVHRIGRTARAGKKGKALSISSEFDYDSLAKLERYLKYKIPVVQPEARYIENISFVRIVQVDRRDGADHVRQERRGSERHARRDARRQDRRGAQARPNQGKAPHGQAQKQHHRARRHEIGGKQERSERRKPQHEHRKGTFAIVPRAKEKAGFFARLVRGVKNLFTRKPSQPQISERTRRLLEQETRRTKTKNRGDNRRRRRGKRKTSRGGNTR